MDENRLRAYLNLIQLLLSCPAGEEGELLQDHSEFVDSGLIEVMQQEASRMAADGEQNAGFLQQLAGQISQFLAEGTQGGDADRNSAYLEVINALLNCPNGEEQQILQANSELLDLGFLIACEAVAATLAEQGEENQANYLLNLASQVGEFLGFTSSEGNDVEDISSQDYFEFLLLLWQTEAENLAGDSQHIYAVLEANIDKLNLNLIPVIQQKAVGILDGIDDPEEAEAFAALIENIAIRISNFPKGSRVDNLEISIAAYKIVLSIRTFETNQEGWARTQNNLATAYRKRIRGERADNIENAITSYTVALEVRTRKAFPQDWAGTQNNLGNAYGDRIRGERAENIEMAIVFYTAALEVYTREAFPEQWAMTQNNLAGAYLYRIRGEKAENMEMAITSYIAALEVRTREAFPQDWATTQNNLAGAYCKIIRGERAENIEMAIASCIAALEVRTREAFPQDWATTQNNLGNAYRQRIRGEKAQNIEMAIASYIAALEVRTREAFPQDWAQTQHNLATAYSDRIRGERAENIEMAIVFYTAALEVYTPKAFPQDWATTQNNLGNAYYSRIRGERADNMERAITSYTAALKVRTPKSFPQDWATTQHNLATAYSDRIRGERADNIEMAIASYTAALKVRTPKAFPQDWATTQNNLGNAYSNKIRGERADNIESAIKCYKEALKVRTREAFPQSHAETLFNLGLAYRNVANLQQARDTFADAIDTVEFLRGEIYSGDESKQKLAEEWNNLYRSMVKVCLELKNYTEAIEYAERSKARNLVELLVTRDVYPKGDIPEKVRSELQRLRQEIEVEKRLLAAVPTADNTLVNQLRQRYNELYPLEPIKFDQIKKLIDDKTAIIEWYITWDKVATFVITSAFPQIQLWQSSEQDLKDLINWMDGYLRNYEKYRNKKSNEWKDSLETKLASLAKILHIDEILAIVSPTVNKLVLIPHRILHLFPLHALPVSQETWLQFNRNRDCPPPVNPYLLDCFLGGVSYAPSCQLLQQAQRRKRDNLSHLFAIQNPTNDLRFADLEVQAISQHFQPQDILMQSDAKKSAIDDNRLRIAHCIHFSCHGYFNFNFNQPLLQSLLLADCELPPPPPEANPARYLPLPNGNTLDLEKCLTLADIFALDLRECRLVVLSACETGITDFRSISDEYISLTSGFLVAGSSSVVSTLWAVNDLSTSLLMIEFYQNLKAGLSVALALNKAQLWLRDVTVEQLEQWRNELSIRPSLKEELYVMLDELDSTEKPPFQSPYHWAAFCATGQ